MEEQTELTPKASSLRVLNKERPSLPGVSMASLCYSINTIINPHDVKS